MKDAENNFIAAKEHKGHKENSFLRFFASFCG
jgi:hypothetical protein